MGNSYVLLYGGPREQGAIDLVGQAQTLLDQAATTDQELAAVAEELTVSLYNLEELVPKLRQYQEEFPQDPNRLTEVEERLELIRSLKRKYGKDIPAILDYVQAAITELGRLQQEEADRTKLTDELTRIKDQLTEAAGRLTNKRRQTATAFEQQLEEELTDLGLDKAQLQVAFSMQEDDSGLDYGERKLKILATGFEQAEFLLTANPGEEPRPLTKIASGGETCLLYTSRCV